MTDEWHIGDAPTVFVTFTDEAGVNTNPTTVTLVVRKPDGSLLTIAQGSMQNPSTGLYRYGLTIDQAGTWNGEWRATGTITAVESFTFVVNASLLGDAPVGYTYDPNTPIGKVRLYSDDRDMTRISDSVPLEQRSAVFSDAEIQVFLDHNWNDVYLAAAEALTTLAGNRSLLVQSRKIGGTSVDYGSARADLLAQAEELRSRSLAQMPYSEFAEMVYDDFGFRRVISNRIQRGDI